MRIRSKETLLDKPATPEIHALSTNEETSEEKLDRILKDAFLNEDEGQIYTMSIERLKQLKEVKGVDADLDDFAKCLAMHMNENEETT